ncbi:MAG: AEC family transporter [Anaerolineaceae bacterium]|nr:AEC family transporter [Anaerolineaceae bacterium]
MTTIAVIAPVFLLVVAGYLATRGGVLKARDVAGLSRFVFNIALPVLLFQSLATVSLPERLDWHFLLAYYLVVLVIYGLGMVLSRRWSGCWFFTSLRWILYGRQWR